MLRVGLVLNFGVLVERIYQNVEAQKPSAYMLKNEESYVKVRYVLKRIYDQNALKQSAIN